MAPTYATPVELGEFLAPDPAPADAVAGRLLDRASRDVRRATRCARYDVDAECLPTSPGILAALKTATLEQAAYRIGEGDEEGIPSGGVASASIVGVSVTRAAGASGTSATVGGLAAQAWAALADAGLTGHAPITDGC
ncbi:hypothetical protein GCM10010402_66150 [Actinomadura luteofluorescens]|uniref:hypothetical protein n=1 Tax=Actinomadura luteofluorescens TaxID=46163 RepID=UPI0021649E8B|nr:hypothetical protein [Actinomadura glauciflava]MCR3744213.1 hypothetical protein [Actinomadura glauciflava]